MSHNIDADSLVGLSNISDYDVTVNKSAELAGQDCQVSLGIQNIKSVRDHEDARARALDRTSLFLIPFTMTR